MSFVCMSTNVDITLITFTFVHCTSIIHNTKINGIPRKSYKGRNLHVQVEGNRNQNLTQTSLYNLLFIES